MTKATKKTGQSRPEPKSILSVDELADELGINRQLAYRYLNAGTIPAIRLGKRFVISRMAIRGMDAVLRRQTSNSAWDSSFFSQQSPDVILVERLAKRDSARVEFREKKAHRKRIRIEGPRVAAPISTNQQPGKACAVQSGGGVSRGRRPDDEDKNSKER